jgi:hypothetical protein
MRREEALRQEKAKEAKLALRAKNVISVKSIRKAKNTGFASAGNSSSPMNRDISANGASSEVVQ